MKYVKIFARAYRRKNIWFYGQARNAPYDYIVSIEEKKTHACELAWITCQGKNR